MRTGHHTSLTASIGGPRPVSPDDPIPVLLTIQLARRALLFVGAGPRAGGEEAAARVERIAGEQADAIWRTARRLGVPVLELQDVAQEVMLVVVRRLVDIDAGSERAFVVATTARVAANWRRARRRRPEELTDHVDELASAAGGHEPSSPFGAEEALERSRKLEILERALSEMTEAQQVSFIMFELEQMTAKEIARALGQPEAAIVSRVRRAREVFRHYRERAAPAARLAEWAPESREK